MGTLLNVNTSEDTFNSPFWNKSFKLGCMPKFLFPPVTEMTSLGNSKPHSFSKRCRTSSGFVPLEMRMNYKKKRIMMRIHRMQICQTSGLVRLCFVLTPRLMHVSIWPVTMPLWHTPSFLVVYSKPPGTQKETIPADPRVPDRPQKSVCTWRHGGHIGVPKQWKGGHVGLPRKSRGS